MLCVRVEQVLLYLVPHRRAAASVVRGPPKGSDLFSCVLVPQCEKPSRQFVHPRIVREVCHPFCVCAFVRLRVYSCVFHRRTLPGRG